MANNEQIIKLIQENKANEFISCLENLPKNITMITDKLNDKEKENMIRWCKGKKIYVIHLIFESVTEISSIEFIKTKKEYYKLDHLLDIDNKTWLHTAVLSNRNLEILQYIITELNVDIDQKDIFNNTALHFSCQKSEYVDGELEILIKKPEQLLMKSIDDQTPLEFACTHKKKLKTLHSMNTIVNLTDLLKQVEDTGGSSSDKIYLYNDQISNKKLWLNLLQNSDKYRLINILKNDKNFEEKYYLKNEEIIQIIKLCHENGIGIVSYINKEYLNNNKTLEDVFIELSGLELKEDDKNARAYYKSSLFLALLTGRFELVPSLLAYCQFDIIPFAIITCLLCKRFLSLKIFPNYVLKNIEKLKDFCEKCAVELLNRVSIRDSTPKKDSIVEFLTMDKYLNKTILNIAYMGKCSKFLSLPSCQSTLKYLWSLNNKNCTKFKFWFHSIFHILFLCAMAYVLIYNFCTNPSSAEYICYAYCLGYLIEEIRQIYMIKKHGIVTFYVKNASNFVDLCALFFIILGFAIRVTVLFTTDRKNPHIIKEIESKSLFATRLVLCISFIFFTMRVIYFGSIYKKIGPKLKMINKMIVRDMIPLIFIFFVFICAFGVVFQSLLFPNSLYKSKNETTIHKQNLITIVGEIFRRATFTIFDAHYVLEELENHSGLFIVDEKGKVTVYFLLIIYIIVANVMLINLLIALFSYTVTVIIKESKESWKASRYKDANEYMDRSLFPPPINILEVPIVIIINTINTIRKKQCLKKNINVEQQELLILNESKKKFHFTSFQILQAFALRRFRYKLAQTKEDIEYEKETEIQSIKQSIDKMNITLESIKKALKI